MPDSLPSSVRRRRVDTFDAAYHVATLLQVSDIARSERDHATAGELVERALFAFGRAAHSTFADRLSHGRARLDFRRRENREFWLAGSMYIANLRRRALWRTAYEWGKLMLSLDPIGDHYCMRLAIDQMALRSGQALQLVEMLRTPLLSPRWSTLPHMSASLALAQLQLRQHGDARRTLFSAIHQRPWLFQRLFQELGIDRIPPSIWGSEPRTDHERLVTELYVHGASDLWKSAEASSLLVEVAGTSERMRADCALEDTPITVDEARHVLLAEDPRLARLLPTNLTSLMVSAADPLPPPDDLPSSTAEIAFPDEPEISPETLTRMIAWVTANADAFAAVIENPGRATEE